MLLRAYAEADLALTLALETDPAAMAQLGGPRPPEAVHRAHRSRLAEPLWCTVAETPEGPGIGTIGAWATEHDGERLYEVGWMVLPAFHGRGIAGRALGLLLGRVRDAPWIDRVHAYPAVGNAASNRLCDRAGFAQLGVVDFPFAGQTLRCNHRALDTPAG